MIALGFSAGIAKRSAAGRVIGCILILLDGAIIPYAVVSLLELVNEL